MWRVEAAKPPLGKIKFFKGGSAESITSIHFSKFSTFSSPKLVWIIFFSYSSPDFLGVAT